MQADHSANFLSKNVQQTYPGQGYKSAMLENWKQLPEVQEKEIPPAHIEGWINGFEAWLDNWWFDVTRNSNNRAPTFVDLETYTQYDSNMPKVKINWANIFGLQGQAAAVPHSASPASRPPSSKSSPFRSGGGPNAPSASEETRKKRETLRYHEKEEHLKQAREDFADEQKNYEAARQRTLDEITRQGTQEAQAKEKKRKAQEEENEAQRLQRELQSQLSELQKEHEARKNTLRQKIDAAESAVTEVKKTAAEQRQLEKSKTPAAVEVVESDDDTSAETRKARAASSVKDPLDRYETQVKIQKKLNSLSPATRNYLRQRGATPYRLLRTVNMMGPTDVEDAVLIAKMQRLEASRDESDEDKERFADALVDVTKSILDLLNSAVRKDQIRQIGPSKFLTWDKFLGSVGDKDDMVVSYLQSQISFLGCAMCANPKAKTVAGCCRQLRYCNQQCADKHWPRHESACGNKK